MDSRVVYLIANSSWFAAFGMQSVVFAWLVTIVLHQPAQMVGLAQTALLLPGMLLILLAGALADRIGPDRQALLAQAFAAVVPWLLIFVLQAGLLTYSAMLIYAVLMGIAQAFVTPSRDGLLNHIAMDRVQHTVLLASLCQFLFQIVGYTFAGFADRIGATTVLAVQSAALTIGVVAYWVLSRRGVVERLPGRPAPVLRSVVEGARTVATSPIMRVVVIQNVAMACFFMGSFIVSFPLMVREVFSGSSADLAWLNGFNSLGLVLTILIMLRIGYVQFPGRALLIFQGLGAVVLAIAGTMNSFILFVASIFMWGLCGGIAMPMARTLMQELAPSHQRGRVMSFFAFSFMGAGPLGTLFCGYLAAEVGPQLAIQICGVAMLVVVIVIGLVTPVWRAQPSTASPTA